MDKNSKFRDIVLVPQALEILKHYFRPDAKPDDYIFPLLDNTAPYAKYVTTADKKTITPDMRKTLYAAVSAKNALINKYLKKIAEKAEISKNVSFHISRHSFAKVANETGLDSGIVKELLAHSNLATTERYMGNFDTQKTDNALINLFGGVEKPKDKKGEVIEALKGMSPEEIAAILSAIKK
jgi:site-specific recombinase XerD